MDNIVEQAQQGSVAAIIQVLNDKLGDSGVRTRAVFADGVLQLLCEAPRVDQLQQSALVQRVQQILESIAPRNIRRVNINSRIVREQQVLWLEEITRDPDNQLLWSEEITLAKPNFFQQLNRNITRCKTERSKSALPKPKSSRRPIVRQQNQLWRGMVSGASLCLFLLLLGWFAYNWLSGKQKNLLPTATSNSLTTATTNQKSSQVSPTSATQTASYAKDDPFAAAVRIANQASATGQTAQTSAQWLDLAARWQRAADLMSAVPPNHSRYKEAQIRTKLYKKYSEAAQEQAQKKPS